MSARVRRRVVDVLTPEGLARAHVSRPSSAHGTLVLGHGAGGGIAAPDLQAVAAAAVAAGWAVVLVEQPWRVAGRKVATAPPKLDVAWRAVVEAVTSGRGALPAPLVVGGRSAGARVACRTAADLGAAAVVALAFPLRPPGKPGAESRAAELARAASSGRPVLVVQGRRDPFGAPGEIESARTGAQVVPVDGDHGLKADTAAVATAVVGLLGSVESTNA
jgi:predicted alpha/beta-hydrolase family hydrolase